MHFPVFKMYLHQMGPFGLLSHSFHEKCEISPADMSFPDEGAVTIRCMKICNFALLKGQGVNNSKNFHD